MRAIYLDMDGTVADLYNVTNWLEMLREEDTTPYQIAAPIPNIDKLHSLLLDAVAMGITVGVISWGAMNASKEYNKATRKVKLDWVREYLPGVISEFHVVKYGTPKHHVRNIKESVLIDDNEEVRNKWKGETIDATNCEEMVKMLGKMLDELRKEW